MSVISGQRRKRIVWRQRHRQRKTYGEKIEREGRVKVRFKWGQRKEDKNIIVRRQWQRERDKGRDTWRVIERERER
jgi:hypothetical protein